MTEKVLSPMAQLVETLKHISKKIEETRDKNLLMQYICLDILPDSLELIVNEQTLAKFKAQYKEGQEHAKQTGGRRVTRGDLKNLAKVRIVRILDILKQVEEEANERVQEGQDQKAQTEAEQ